jgi:hypothetical protein
VSTIEQINPGNSQIPLRSIRRGGIMASGKISKREEYQRYAKHCLDLVSIATSQKARIIQREMAAEWLKLATVIRRPSTEQMK